MTSCPSFSTGSVSLFIFRFQFFGEVFYFFVYRFFRSLQGTAKFIQTVLGILANLIAGFLTFFGSEEDSQDGAMMVVCQ